MTKWSLNKSDSLTYLKTLDDVSIECVITDPPYGLDAMNEKWDEKKIDEFRSKKSRIGNIPVGMKFDSNSAKNMADSLLPIAKELIRILKPGGFCLMFSQARSSHRIGVMLEDAGFELRDQLIWDYTAGQGKAQGMENFIRKNKNLENNRSKKLELIEQLKGMKTPQLTPTFETIWLAQKPKDGKFWENYIKHGVGLVNMSKGSVKVKFKHNKPSGVERKAGGGHPTQKPVKLIEDLIKVFTKENDTILDCFCGSGTTGVASLSLNRNFIGIDMSEKFIKISADRIKWIP